MNSLLAWLALTQLQESRWVTPRAEGEGIVQEFIESRTVSARVSFHVWMPPGTERSQKVKLPVLYWLHGSGGGQAGIPRLSALFARAVKTEKIPPLIVVFPHGLPNGMWTDSADGRSPVESLLIKEILPEVEKRFPVSSRREDRIIDGFSMGGYGAARLGFKHPLLFAAVSLLGAGPLQRDLLQAPEASRINPLSRQRILDDVYGGSTATFYEQSPLFLAEFLAKSTSPHPSLRIAIGDRDFTLPANHAFHQRLTQLGIKHSFTIVPDVGHDPLALISAMKDEFWNFYRQALKE